MATRLNARQVDQTAQSQRLDTMVIENPRQLITGANKAPLEPGMYRVGLPGHRALRRMGRASLMLEKVVAKLAGSSSGTEFVCFVHPERPSPTCAGRGGNE